MAPSPQSGGVTHRGSDAAKTLAARERRCRRGDARACYLAGTDYQFRRGTVQNYKRAAGLYRRACETRSPPKGIPEACTNLGFLYAHGYGLKREIAKAILYYRRGCDGGNLRGCNNLGVLYDHGKHGVTRDYARARSFFDRACKAKLALACSNLALLYRKGHGVKKDPRRAQRLFEAACVGKSSAGCRHAGWGVLRGHAGRRDWRAARRHFARGCDLARSAVNRGSCRARARMLGLEGPLGVGVGGGEGEGGGGVTSGATCQRRGLWRPHGGNLVALSHAGASRLESFVFGSLGWHSDLMARVVIRRRAGAHLRVALDDGRIQLRALVIPTRTGYAPTFYLAGQHQASPVLWLAPGLSLRLRGHGSGVQATVPYSVLTTLGRRKVVVGLSCDQISLHRPAWKRPARWPAGERALGRRELVVSADVPLAAKPRGRTWAHVRRQQPSKQAGVLGSLRVGGKGSAGRSVNANRKRLPTLMVELLAKRGPWQRIRYQGYRYGFVGWVRGKLLRSVATGALSALIGVGGLGVSGRSRRSGKRPRRWRCRREVPLSVRRPGAPPRRIGVLHPNTRFTVVGTKSAVVGTKSAVVGTKSAVVAIRIPGLRWLRLLPKAELTIPAKALRTACK